MHTGKINLLLIEDNAGDAYLFKLALNEAGSDRFSLTHAGSIAEAREAIEREPFDIIMLDLSLPDSQGLETVREMVNLRHRLPIVVLTGMEDEETALQALHLGAQDYLQKGSISSPVLVRSMLHAIERNQMKLELETLNENKNKFFSIISHDLRSPFYSLVQVTKHLIENFDDTDTETVKSHLRIIGSTSEKLYALVENLLQWAGSQTGRIEVRRGNILLRMLTESVFDILQENAKQKNITLQNMIEETAVAWADKNMIHTVLRNLVSNGIKFSSSGGTVAVSSRTEAGTIHISISDSGIGMSRESVDKLFRPDSRSTRPGTAGEQGTGLGLIVCHEFIQKNDGRVSVTSTENEGTTFTVSLPVRAPVAEGSPA